MVLLVVLWWVSFFVIYWAMIGYPLSLVILNKIIKRKNVKDNSYEPTVTVMVVAHNEEKVILAKLNNLLELDYNKEKIDFLIASDFCTDATDSIIEEFIKAHPQVRIRINKSINHNGKTNAQNETQPLCDSEILVMTDANSMFEPNAVRELVSAFSDPSIVYVTGQLKYTNASDNKTANSEGLYWKIDLMCRSIESKIQTITAGNGAIYAVRNKEYRKLSMLECHDASFPIVYALEKKRAVYNKDAIAYEKASEEQEDEFKRKVRMNRLIVHGILPDIRILNIFKYHWFSYFYFGHRTCRYLLWLAHLLVLLLNIPLAVSGSVFWIAVMILQLAFYLSAIIGLVTKSRSKLFRITSYYLMTVLAQWKGVINTITGKNKPVWEKADSTR